LIHLKDYAVRDERGPRMAALGEGNLDLPGIVAAAERGGCRWFIVEQDQDFDDAFLAIERSFRFLSEQVVS
jgi:sugar phosphate isomerase/epimerase